MHLMCLSIDSETYSDQVPWFLSRQKYFNYNSFAELFEKSSESNIIEYLEEIGFYGKF